MLRAPGLLERSKLALCRRMPDTQPNTDGADRAGRLFLIPVVSYSGTATRFR